jgi:hypothetical protein
MQSPVFRLALAAVATLIVTLTPSTLTYKQAASACGTSALGSVTFTLGHSRSASLPGVTEQVDTSSSGVDTITFTRTSSGESAVVTANGHAHTVSAKNVQAKWHNQLACVLPD